MLKRLEQNRVARWAIAYLAGAWIALQVFGFVWQVFDLPIILLRIIVAFIAFGLVAILAMALRGAGAAASKTHEAHHAHGHRRGLTIASIVVAAALLVGVGFSVNRMLERQWARGEAILEARADFERGDLDAALAIVERALALLPEARRRPLCIRSTGISR